MKYSICTLVTLILFGCSSPYESKFFKDCQCETIDITNGTKVIDKLKTFSFTNPKSFFPPDRAYNGITVLDSSLGYVRLFNINRIEIPEEFNLKKEQKKIEAVFNVTQKGEIEYQNKKCLWNIILQDEGIPNLRSLYLTIPDEKNEFIYNLCITVEESEDYKTKLCQMESLIDSFEIINK